MNLQLRIVLAMVLLAAVAIGTGSVLLLGYFLAVASLGTIVFVIGRKAARRVLDARFARSRFLPRAPKFGRQREADDIRRAA